MVALGLGWFRPKQEPRPFWQDFERPIRIHKGSAASGFLQLGFVITKCGFFKEETRTSTLALFNYDSAENNDCPNSPDLFSPTLVIRFDPRKATKGGNSLIPQEAITEFAVFDSGRDALNYFRNPDGWSVAHKPQPSFSELTRKGKQLYRRISNMEFLNDYPHEQIHGAIMAMIVSLQNGNKDVAYFRES